MVPGVFTMDNPWRAASPDRGWTSATYPSGRARAIPVGTSARSPGARVRSTVDIRSAPASPGWAYDGSGRPGSSRTTATGRPSPVLASGTGSGTRRTLPPLDRDPGWLAVPVSDKERPPSHHERLSVPLRWWVQGTMLVATFWLAFVVATPAPVAWTATAVLLLGMTLLFLVYGSPRV